MLRLRLTARKFSKRVLTDLSSQAPLVARTALPTRIVVGSAAVWKFTAAVKKPRAIQSVHREAIPSETKGTLKAIAAALELESDTVVSENIARLHRDRCTLDTGAPEGSTRAL